MIPTMAQVSVKAHQILNAQVAWARQEFHLPNLNPQLVLWDKRTGPEGQASWTKNRLKVKVFNYIRFPCTGFTEYASYAWRPEVGAFKTDDWTLNLEALIAHEMAHFVHFGLKYATKDHPLREGDIFRGIGQFDRESHGYFFQRILLQFRRKFVNDRIAPGAATTIAKDFDTEGDFEARMAAMPTCPYEGMEFNIGNYRLKVAGYNPNTTKKLYKYQAEDRTRPGKFYAVKLRDIINNCPAAKAKMEADSKLRAEYAEHMGAISSKNMANARSRATKQRRAAYRRMAA